MSGPWEVELKFVVSDPLALLEQLARQQAVEQETEQHIDIYLAHPCRDFKATDEAFRLRQFNSQACMTYKGKRLPGKVKTRPEIELSIRLDEIPQWLQMMQHLGFRPLPEVRKSRRIFRLPNVADQPTFTVTLDNVADLGTFAEVELVVQQASELDSARGRIESLATSLLLQDVQPRSYLSLLLEKLQKT